MMSAVGDESVWSAPGDQPGGGPPVPPPVVPGPPAPGQPAPGQPGPWPAAYQPAGGQQRRTIRRGAMTLILIVAFLGVGSCTAFIVGAVQLARGPIKATDQYFADIKKADFSAAAPRECGYVQEIDTVASLQGMYSTDPVVSWHAHGFSESSSVGANDEATVAGTLTTASGSRDLIVDLQQIADEWRICGGVPTPR